MEINVSQGIEDFDVGQVCSYSGISIKLFFPAALNVLPTSPPFPSRIPDFFFMSPTGIDYRSWRFRPRLSGAASCYRGKGGTESSRQGIYTRTWPDATYCKRDSTPCSSFSCCSHRVKRDHGLIGNREVHSRAFGPPAPKSIDAEHCPFEISTWFLRRPNSS